MIGKNAKLGGALGAALLTIGALSTTSCEEGSSPLDDLANACGFDCAPTGILEGNASISGNGAIDDFFASVVKYQGVSASVAAKLYDDLGDIRSGFNISDAELTAANNDLSVAIDAKIKVATEGKLVVRAAPARCDVDARASFEAQARCEASAACDAQVTPGSVSVSCQGSCEADVSVMASCQAGATLSCVVRKPELTCAGQCNGQCTVSGQLAAQCNGTCNGECVGTCAVKDAAGNCAGQCSGTCNGSCTLATDITASCNGSCSGECTYTPPSGSCEAGATVRCEAAANASIMCQGTCDGQVTPPMARVDCEASASCQASARAEASLSVQCTPPRVEVDWVPKGGMAQAQAIVDVRNGVNTLRARMPSLLTSIKKGRLVQQAGTRLAADAVATGNAAISAVGDSSMDIISRARVARCVPGELAKVPQAITAGSVGLNTQLNIATSVTGILGMTLVTM